MNVWWFKFIFNSDYRYLKLLFLVLFLSSAHLYGREVKLIYHDISNSKILLQMNIILKYIWSYYEHLYTFIYSYHVIDNCCKTRVLQWNMKWGLLSYLIGIQNQNCVINLLIMRLRLKHLADYLFHWGKFEYISSKYCEFMHSVLMNLSYI